MKLTKILSAVLAVLMLFSAGLVGVTAEEKLPFTDVPAGEWYYDAVAYTYGNGLMNGTGDGTKFSPSMNLTRGMVVTVLYRNYGAPKVNSLNPFADVKDDAYYGAAAVWAYHSKVVTGTGEDEWGDPLFSPDRNITRQELATMIGRYAAHCHVDTSKDTADIGTFPDSGKVASWATDTVKWAAGTGIITGKGTGSSATLSPEDLATRAEFTTIIKRFNDKDDAREFTYKLAYTEPMPKSSYTEPTYEPCDDADVFVSVDGSDTNPGTKDKPLATFEGAVAKVRELKKDAKDEIVVAFMAGNYGTLDNVTFTSEDSGTADIPITYRVYGDGDVIFQNGVLLTPDEFVPANESDYHLLGDVDKTMVYKIDLSDKIDSFSDKNILFSETGMCHEARIPNKITGYRENAYYSVTTTYNERESILLQNYLPDIVEGFRSIEGMKVTGMLRTGWLVDTFPVKSYDTDTNVLVFDFENCTFDNGYSLDDYVLAEEGRMDDYVFFHNLSDQIDAEGEYWFNPDTFTLYMYKPEGNHYISTHDTFMTLENGAEYLSFVGLDFITSKSNAIYVKACHTTFDGCTVGNVAGEACIISEKGYPMKDIVVKNCEFYNFYDKGLHLFGKWMNLLALVPTEIEITNNYFHDFSSPQTFGAAINLTSTVGVTVSHNEFVNGAHAAINFGGCADTIVEYNVMDNMMNSTLDYGAVYSYNTILTRGNVVRYNIIKNIRTAGGCHGVYVDGSFAHEVYGNIFYNSGDKDVTLNGGRENDIHDNISIRSQGKAGDFLFYGYGPSSKDENGNFVPSPDTYNATLQELQYLPAEGEDNYDVWHDKWPLLYEYSYDINDIDKYECIYRTVNYINDNALVGSKLVPMDAYLTFGEAENNVEYSLDVNPFFADPTHGDYSITDTTKFADNHFDKIGRY